jgi:hypothetical protein
VEERYGGIPIGEVPIEEVDVPDPTHLQRSRRYPNALDIAPEQAVQAALDPRRRVRRDASSRVGETLRVLGYSRGADRMLVVLLLPHDHPPTGSWHVATAWPSGPRARAAYHAEEGEH